MNRENEEYEIDLLEVLEVIKKKFWAILLAAVIFASSTAVYCFVFATPIYNATSKIYILSQSTSITSLADIQIGTSLANDYLELIKSRPVVNQVIEHLDLDYDYDAVVGMLKLENPSNTRIIKITVTGADQVEIQNMANEFASVSKRQISTIMKTDEPTVVEDAIFPESPIKPQKAKTVAIAFLIGAMLQAAVCVFKNILDDSIKGKEDVEKYLGLSVLAYMPDTVGLSDNKGKKKKVVRKMSLKGGRK